MSSRVLVDHAHGERGEHEGEGWKSEVISVKASSAAMPPKKQIQKMRLPSVMSGLR